MVTRIEMTDQDKEGRLDARDLKDYYPVCKTQKSEWKVGAAVIDHNFVKTLSREGRREGRQLLRWGDWVKERGLFCLWFVFCS